MQLRDIQDQVGITSAFYLLYVDAASVCPRCATYDYYRSLTCKWTCSGSGPTNSQRVKMWEGIEVSRKDFCVDLFHNPNQTHFNKESPFGPGEIPTEDKDP